MSKVTTRLTVFFEEPFWIGVFERIEDGRLSAVKVTFGAEPKDYEVSEFISKNYYGLKFSPAVAAAVKERTKNPKRMRRDVKKQLKDVGTGTKSQQALKLQQEQLKTERKHKSRQQREDDLERKFELRQQKKKNKHRGR